MKRKLRYNTPPDMVVFKGKIKTTQHGVVYDNDLKSKCDRRSGIRKNSALTFYGLLNISIKIPILET